jgi:uncharacterized phage protein (TIGR02220 family)
MFFDPYFQKNNTEVKMEALPYFKFYPAEWALGDITMCSFEAQGLFINILSFYWTKNGSITKAMLKQRFSNALTLLDELEKLKIFKVKGDEERIEIKFLDCQYKELSEKRKKRQNAGRKGGSSSKQCLSNAKPRGKAMPKHLDKIRRDLDKIREDKILVLGGVEKKAKEILKKLNFVTGCNYNDPGLIIQNLLDGKTIEEHLHIIEVKSHDPHFRENPQFMAPTTLFGRKFDTYKNQTIEMFIKKQNESKTQQVDNPDDYFEKE